MANPVYAQIAEALRHTIQQKVYQVGDRIPTESQLAAQFGVNRHTIRSAIALLRDEGIVRVEQGRGTFVISAPIRYAIGSRVRYNEALKAQGKKPKFKLLQITEIIADDAIATALEIPDQNAAILLERLSFADDEPISVNSSYFPAYLFPDLVSQVNQTYSSFQQALSVSKLLWDIYQCDHLRRSTSISARKSKPSDARLLQIPIHYPVLVAESINVNRQGTVIEYGVTRFRSDRMELVFENNLDLKA